VAEVSQKADLNRMIQKLAEERDRAYAANASLAQERNGTQLVNFILLRRAGGLVTITQEEMLAAFGGQIRVVEKEGAWSFEALVPDPEPPEGQAGSGTPE
jgi:hypothetical protein